MLIRVQGPHGVISLEVQLVDKILEIKYKIQDKKGYPPEKQRIFFQRRPLEDNRCLSDYDITPDSLLELELQLKIHVKTACVSQFNIDCFPSFRIIDLKDEIYRKVAIPSERQILSHKDIVLKDPQLISECRLLDGDFILLSGLNKVTINFTSGKSICYPTSQKTSILDIKKELRDREHIPVDKQQLNFKGREVANEQTLLSIRYTDVDCLILDVIRSDPSDTIHIIVKTPNGDKYLVTTNKLHPVGNIVDALGLKGSETFSHCLYFDKVRLEDENFLNFYERIKMLSELILKPCDNSIIPVVVTAINGDVETFYLKPDENLVEVKARIRNKFGLPQEHQKLFYKHRILPNEGIVGTCDFTPGDNLLLGPEDSILVTIQPPSRAIEILTLQTDKMWLLKQRVERKEKIPTDLQEFGYMGSVLDDEMVFSDYIKGVDSPILVLSIRKQSSNFLKIKIRDLEGNWFKIDKFDKFWKIETLKKSLKLKIPIQDEDLFVHSKLIMALNRPLCTYGISSGSEVWIASKTPNLITQRLQPPNPVQSLPILPPPSCDTCREDANVMHHHGELGPIPTHPHLGSASGKHKRPPQVVHQHSEPAINHPEYSGPIDASRHFSFPDIQYQPSGGVNTTKPPTPIHTHGPPQIPQGYAGNIPTGFPNPQGASWEYQNQPGVSYNIPNPPHRFPTTQDTSENFQGQYGVYLQNFPNQPNISSQNYPNPQGASYRIQTPHDIPPLSHPNVATQNPQNRFRPPQNLQYPQGSSNRYQTPQATFQSPQNKFGASHNIPNPQGAHPSAPSVPTDQFANAEQPHYQDDLIQLSDTLHQVEITGSAHAAQNPSHSNPRRDYFSQPVSNKTHQNIPSSLIHPQPEEMTSRPTEVTMHIEHPFGGLIPVKCMTDFTVKRLKEEISHPSMIPVNKMKLKFDDIFLVNEDITLSQYNILFERIIKFNDLLCINVQSRRENFIVWMNGCDFVSGLISEIANKIPGSQDHQIVIRHMDQILDPRMKLNYYCLPEISDVNVDFI